MQARHITEITQQFLTAGLTASAAAVGVFLKSYIDEQKETKKIISNNSSVAFGYSYALQSRFQNIINKKSVDNYKANDGAVLRDEFDKHTSYHLAAFIAIAVKIQGEVEDFRFFLSTGLLQDFYEFERLIGNKENDPVLVVSRYSRNHVVCEMKKGEEGILDIQEFEKQIKEENSALSKLHKSVVDFMELLISEGNHDRKRLEIERLCLLQHTLMNIVDKIDPNYQAMPARVRKRAASDEWK